MFPWEYIVTLIDGDEVTVSQESEIGDIIPLNELFFLQISELTDEKIVTLLTVEDQTVEVPTGNLTVSNGPIYITMTLTPPLGERIALGDTLTPGKVLSFDNDTIVLDYNADYAGENIVFKVKLLSK